MSLDTFRGEELESLAKYRTVKHDRCIACDANTFYDWAQSGSYMAVKCSDCGLIWMNPQLNRAGLKKYYSDYIGRRRISDRKKMDQRDIQYKDDVEFIEKYIKTGRMLDVGCSGGFFLAKFNSSFDKYGVEIDSEAVSYAKEHQEFGGNIQCASIEEDVFSEKFDLIVMRGTIEHVPDPVNIVKRVSALLTDGGYYSVTATPNSESFCADFYRDKWTLFHPVQHIWHFSPYTLSLICKNFGLKLIASDFPYIGTPYEDICADIKQISEDITKKEAGDTDLSVSPPFFSNMMSLIFKKH
jgi:2-polyprenyl-3-methyl-5-hydroxy-6-metoxy-1,4-benzoquinol methylase